MGKLVSYRKKENWGFPKKTGREEHPWKKNISYKLDIAFLIKANCSQLGGEEEGKTEGEVETSKHLMTTTKKYFANRILPTVKKVEKSWE